MEFLVNVSNLRNCARRGARSPGNVDDSEPMLFCGRDRLASKAFEQREMLAHFTSNLRQTQCLATLNEEVAGRLVIIRLENARDGAHDVQWTSVLRGPERSVDSEPMHVCMGS